MPGVQKPHCSALRRDEGLLQVGDLAASDTPSMVSTSAPAHCTASMRQPRTVTPSSRTVQAPHTPCSQPTWLPVSPSRSRRKSTRFCAHVDGLVHLLAVHRQRDGTDMFAHRGGVSSGLSLVRDCDGVRQGVNGRTLSLPDFGEGRVRVLRSMPAL